MNQPYTVVVILKAKSGHEADLKEAILRVTRESRQEDACLTYRCHQNRHDPQEFVLYEIWESQEKHAVHVEEPHVKTFFDALDAFLVEPPTVIFCEELMP